jgi:hypothetical protein
MSGDNRKVGQRASLTKTGQEASQQRPRTEAAVTLYYVHRSVHEQNYLAC